MCFLCFLSRNAGPMPHLFFTFLLENQMKLIGRMTSMNGPWACPPSQAPREGQVRSEGLNGLCMSSLNPHLLKLLLQDATWLWVHPNFTILFIRIPSTATHMITENQKKSVRQLTEYGYSFKKTTNDNHPGVLKASLVMVTHLLHPRFFPSGLWISFYTPLPYSPWREPAYH